MNNDFVVFILTHGRPDSVVTYKALKNQGYTGKIYLIIDNEDKTSAKYYKKYGDEVIMFDKAEVEKTCDTLDNFEGRQAILYARNACFDIAEKLGAKYFLQLDDDYTQFIYRILDHKDKICTKKVLNLDKLFKTMLDFYKTTSAKSIAFAQGGDFIGGMASNIAKGRLFTFNPRKAMNTFFCSTERRFSFIGKMNDDVNTYVYYQSQGNLFLTVGSVSINQKSSQGTAGGMSEYYKLSGTYVKSFYTVLVAPSSVKVKVMHTTHRRLHHSIDWKYAVPVIIDSKYKKI